MSKRRAIEWGKNVLIVLLLASAVWLVTLTPLVQDSGLADLFSSREDRVEGEGVVVLGAAAHPSRMAVMGSAGRYGIQYDRDTVDELFARTGSLLGECLTSAEAPEEITETRWRLNLSQKGIYFDFERGIPLSALGSWLHSEGECALEGTARRILLTEGDEDRVQLCWQNEEDGLFYACATGLSVSLHLEPLVAAEESNGARFAFEMGKEDSLLHPYTLMTDVGDGVVYTGGNPLFTQTEVDELLRTLSFGEDNSVPVSGGTAYLEGTARLEVGDNGVVTYSDGHEQKYPVSKKGGEPTVAELIEVARQLAESTIGRNCGEARLYLESVRETEEGWLIRFGYRLNGSTVWLYEDGWAARILLREGYVSEFTLRFRSYTVTEEKIMLLPMDRAAAILPGVTKECCELELRYGDNGSRRVVPGWVAV